MGKRTRKTNIGGLGAVYRGIYLQIAAALITALAVCARVSGGALTVVAVLVVLLSVLAALMLLLGLSVSAGASAHFRRGRIFCLINLILIVIGFLAWMIRFRSLGLDSLTPQIVGGVSAYLICLAVTDVLTLAGALNGCAQFAGMYGEKLVGIRCRLLWILSLLAVIAAVALVFLFVSGGATAVTQAIEENGGTVDSFDAFYGKLKPLVILFILFVADFLIGLILRFRMAGRIRYCLRAYHGKQQPVEEIAESAAPAVVTAPAESAAPDIVADVAAPAESSAAEAEAPADIAARDIAPDENRPTMVIPSEESAVESIPDVGRPTMVIPAEESATESIRDEGRPTVMIPSDRMTSESTLVGVPSKNSPRRASVEEIPTIESMLSDYISDDSISSENNG